MKAWTDSLFLELGDSPQAEAPVRECEAIHFNGKDLVTIVIGDFAAQVDARYVYRAKGRYTEVPQLTDKELATLR